MQLLTLLTNKCGVCLYSKEQDQQFHMMAAVVSGGKIYRS